MAKKAAHFLLNEHIWNSPPNDALSRVYEAHGIEVDYYAPNSTQENLLRVEYGLRWLLKNIFNRQWAHYDVFSCTSEDPIVIAGLLSVVWRKPLIFISDEIKSGSYSGDRKPYWKRLCRWLMRRAKLTIVNDESRVALQQTYANLDQQPVVVYPGCFLQPPKPQQRSVLRKAWGIADDDVVASFSGSCDLMVGVDWALESLDEIKGLHMVMQPLSMDELSLYLIKNHRNTDSIYFENQRLSWQDSWSSIGGVDIGVAIYNNPAPQFQNMGISSNRLCMFIAMGVPVIVSKQPSFQFLEDYQCGIMVENAQEFADAVRTISSNLQEMKKNALRCADEYINTAGRFEQLNQSVARVLN